MNMDPKKSDYTLNMQIFLHSCRKKSFSSS